jgi:SAM-dependent methyltransferase
MPSSLSELNWADAWQRSWDRLEEGLIPNREWFLSGLIDVVEATVGAQPVVIDLACGTGTVTLRLRDRLPKASVIAIDVDPVLLKIASATFANDAGVRIAAGDLREPTWRDVLPVQSVDAVVTATALHWLPEKVVRRLYHELADIIRVEGVFAHSEYMPLVHGHEVGGALRELLQRRSARVPSTRSWDEWWAAAGADPELEEAFKLRSQVFGHTYPPEEFSPPALWHQTALIEAGFREASVVYRAVGGAVVAALR